MSDTLEISDKVLTRLRAIMAKTVANGCTEAEASAAADKVNEILQAYNMSLTDLDTQGATNADEGAARTKEVNANAARAANYSWQVKLMKAIAEANFCRHWVEEVLYMCPAKRMIPGKRHALLGRKVNIISSNLMYDYLQETMVRLNPYAVAGKQQSKASHSWRLGCSERLAARIVDKHRADMENSKREKAARDANRPAGSAPGALVLVDVYASESDLNEDFLYELPPGTTTRNRLEREAKRNDPAEVAKRQAEREAWEAKWKAEREAVEAERVARLAKETPEQRAKREDREAEKTRREGEKFWNRAYREQARNARKIDHSAYNAGKATAESISLNRQMAAEEKKRLA